MRNSFQHGAPTVALQYCLQHPQFAAGPSEVPLMAPGTIQGMHFGNGVGCYPGVPLLHPSTADHHLFPRASTLPWQHQVPTLPMHVTHLHLPPMYFQAGGPPSPCQFCSALPDASAWPHPMRSVVPDQVENSILESKFLIRRYKDLSNCCTHMYYIYTHFSQVYQTNRHSYIYFLQEPGSEQEEKSVTTAGTGASTGTFFMPCLLSSLLALPQADLPYKIFCPLLQNQVNPESPRSSLNRIAYLSCPYVTSRKSVVYIEQLSPSARYISKVCLK